MNEPTIPHIEGRPQGAWVPPGLNRDAPAVEVPGLGYRVLWSPELAAAGWPRRGGMGRAWLGQHRNGGDLVVLKFLDPLFVSPGDEGWRTLRQLFGQEAGVDLHGDHLISSKHHDDPGGDWRPVLVMQRASCSFADILADVRETPDKRLPLALIKQLLHDAALGLHRLHEKHGLVHDDVKPGNLFLRLHGGRAYEGLSSLEVKDPRDDRRYDFEGAVGDFGVARKLRQPRPLAFRDDGFKAPEQLRAGEPADPRTDLFGFGRTMKELLQFSREAVPVWMNELVEECARPGLDRRPGSAAAVAWALSSQRDHFRSFGLEPDRHNPFVERRAAREAFERFRRDPRLRVLHVKGDPGTGKTALLTHWAADVAPSAAYFLSCIGAASLRSALFDLLQSLIEAFRAPVTLPNQLDGRVVRSILDEVLRPPSCPVTAGESLLLYIDALDEADDPADVERLVPVELPERIKLIVSSRHEPRFRHLEEAEHRLEFNIDAPEHRQRNREEAEDCSHSRLAGLLPRDLCAEAARALGANFQLIDIYCSDLGRRAERGELDLAAVRSELADLSRDFDGDTQGEDAFHRFYLRYVWDPAFRLVEEDVARSELFVRLAGLLAAAEAPIPVRVLRTVTGRVSDGVVESLLKPLRRSLRQEQVRGEGGDLVAYRYAHKTLQTFITSKHGPVNDPEQVAGYRQQILDHYARQPNVAAWDHFGLRSVVRLWLRQGRPDQAVAWLKKHDFIETVTKTREPGLGVDGLREMVRQVREAAG